MIQARQSSVDIAMCIDATGDMKEIMERVKEHAIALPRLIKEAGETPEAFHRVVRVRVRVIVFRDFAADEEPLRASPFFDWEKERDAFEAYVRAIVAQGGGDPEENSLEALAVAMRSEWERVTPISRHIILLFTNASAHSLGDRFPTPNYPADLPKSMDELQSLWEFGMPNSRRLVLFAPPDALWKQLEWDWRDSRLIPSLASADLTEEELREAARVAYWMP